MLEGSLPFTQTTRVKILCKNLKLYDLTWWENGPLKVSLIQPYRSSRKMDSPQITAQFSTEMREPFDFSTEIFLPGSHREHTANKATNTGAKKKTQLPTLLGSSPRLALCAKCRVFSQRGKTRFPQPWAGAGKICSGFEFR